MMNIITVKNHALSIYIYSLSLYIFFSAPLGAFDLIFIKKFFIIVMLLSLLTYLAFSLNLKNNFLEYSIYIGIPILMLIDFFIWGNAEEINLIFSILLGYVAYHKKNKFLQIIVIILIIQGTAVLYEFLSNNYIFTSVIQGIEGSKIDEVNPDKFGDVGFRPKGLFYGNLDATSFVIGSAFIFRNNTKVLSLLYLMSVMLNGRLAILVVSIIFFTRIISNLHYINIKPSLLVKFITPFVVLASLIILIATIVKLQSAEAVDNLKNIFNLSATSNSARILYMLTGLYEYLNYSTVHKLFGNSGYFKDVYKNSAESGLINQLLNIGLIGTSLYVYAIIKAMIDAAAKKQYYLLLVVFLLMFSLSVYRHDAGYMRGVMLWFFLFSIYNKNPGTAYSTGAFGRS